MRQEMPLSDFTAAPTTGDKPPSPAFARDAHSRPPVRAHPTSFAGSALLGDGQQALDITGYLRTQGFRFTDKRPRQGALWINPGVDAGKFKKLRDDLGQRGIRVFETRDGRWYTKWTGDLT